MRPKVLFFVLFVGLVILAVLFWHRSVKPPAIQEPAIETTFTNSPERSVANRNVSNRLPSSVALPANPRQSATNDTRPSAWFQADIESHNAPIEFYGKVIDQYSNVLAGAKINIGIRHWTPADPANFLAGSEIIHLNQTSDSDGRFEFHGATGDGFGIGITKDGYELEPNRYGFGPNAGSYGSPIVFKMWSTNIHEQLITGEKKFQIVSDGRVYFINLTEGTIAESGIADLKVWIKYPAQVTRGQLYDWSCEIDAVNGGLLEQPLGTTMYQAPADGYRPSLNVQQQITGGQFGETGERHFYVSLKNGQEYGQISIRLYAPYTDQIPGLIRLSYAINPSGSRILR